LEIKKKIISEEDNDIINTDAINTDAIKKTELFTDSQKNETNQSITIIIFIVSFMLIVNFLYVMFINNFFTPAKNIDDSDLPQYLSEIIGQNMKTILSTKFKYYSILFWQTIITFILIILLIIYMSNNSNEQSIYMSILIFLFLIFINGIIICILNIRYFIYRLKSIYDDDFSQKENYLFNYILKETYKGNIFGNIINIIKEDFSSFLKLDIQLNPQTGGENKLQEDNIYHNNLVPGPINDEESLKIYKNKATLDQISFFKFYKLFDPSVISIIHEKFKDNKSWTTNGYILIFIIILFFVIGILFQLKYISTANNSLLKIIISSIVLSCLYLPIILLIISLGYYFVIDSRLQIAVIIISVIGLIIALFIPGGIIGDKKKNWLNNIPFWICISFFIISILLVIIGKYTRKDLLDMSGSKGSGELYKKESAPINEYYEVLKVKLDEEEEKRILYQSELEKLYLIDENKDEKIKELTQKQDSTYIQSLENEILSLKDKLKEYNESKYNESNDINKNSSLLVLKDIKDEQKEKEIFLKSSIEYYEYSINDLRNHIEKILENARLFKLYTVTSNLLYTLKLIDKLKKIEEKRSDINYNDEILRILNKLKKINPLEDITEDFNQEFKTDLERLTKIKNNSLYKDFEQELSSITLKIKNIANQIKEIVVKVKS